MSTQSAADIIAAKMAGFRQRQEGGGTLEGVQIITPGAQRLDTSLIIVKPPKKSWEDLVSALDSMGALDSEGLYRQCILKTVRDLFNQGYSAELEATAELAIKLANKKPASHYFARSVSKKGGNWGTKTLAKVRETWQVRKTALRVMEQLKLDSKITNYILSLAWKFKGTLVRFLSIATEKGYGITNPAGYFFGIIKTLEAAT